MTQGTTQGLEELRIQLLDYFIVGAPSYRLANNSCKSAAEAKVNEILPMIEQELTKARLDEARLNRRVIEFLSHDDDAYKAMTNRIATLATKLNQEKL